MGTPGPRFVVLREAKELNGKTRRWAYVDACPHGMDIGAIQVSDTSFMETVEGRPRPSPVWEFHDLGNGRCRIAPSLLFPKLHDGQDCHFGPGEFPFIWLEPGELRNTEPFFSRWKAWVGET